MKRDKIELTGGFGVEIVVCANTETLADGREGIDAEAADKAVRAASNVICDTLGGFPSLESNFSEWHGGRCYGQRPDLPGRFVVANIYQRDEDGDWDWQGWSKISANMQAEIKAACEAAEDALIASLDEDESEQLDMADTSSVTDDTPALIEASDDEHPNWDSDYVGNEPMTVAEARAYVATLQADPEWAGWKFRIMACVDGSYSQQV